MLLFSHENINLDNFGGVCSIWCRVDEATSFSAVKYKLFIIKEYNMIKNFVT